MDTYLNPHALSHEKAGPVIMGFYLFWAVVAYVVARAWVVPTARRGAHAWVALALALARLGFAAA